MAVKGTSEMVKESTAFEAELSEIFQKIVKDYIELKVGRKLGTDVACKKQDEVENQNDSLGPFSSCDHDGKSLSLENEFYSNLLQHDEGNYSGRNVFLDSMYPQYPLLKKIAAEIYEWAEKERCPFTSRPPLSLLNEDPSKEKREKLRDDCDEVLKKIRSILVRLRSSASGEEYKGQTSKDGGRILELKFHVSKLLEILQERGILHLLGVRETVGSIIKVPPSSLRLMESFLALQNEMSKLTVGARALSKHFHRCKNEWWGECKGSESEKNENALNILLKIVDDCVWINIHLLPHDYEVIEIR